MFYFGKFSFRLCYKYPLNGINNKISGESHNEKLLNLFKIKEKVVKFVLNKYLNKQVNRYDKAGDLNIQKKLIAKICFLM